LACALDASASAQEFPSKTITMVVGFAAGGATDTAARIIAKKLTENLGQTVLVDNRAGAGAISRTSRLPWRAGWLYDSARSVGALHRAALIAKLPYDPQRDSRR